jgi:predicted transcriptional regulator
MTEQNKVLHKVEALVGGLESTAIDLVARLSPWLAPLPTAYLTATATVEHLAWPEPVGAVAGVIVEALGLSAVSTALTLREYNAMKRKSDPGAPFGLAVALGGVYFASVTFLTVALDTFPQLATFAPLVFPALSLAGVTVLGIRADHRRRLEAIAESKAERKAKRQDRRPRTVRQTVSEQAAVGQVGVRNAVQNAGLDAVNVSRRERKAAVLDTMLDVYLDSPETGPTEIARRLGIGRSTVYNYLDDLEAAGRISRGNGRIEVSGVS